MRDGSGFAPSSDAPRVDDRQVRLLLRCSIAFFIVAVIAVLVGCDSEGVEPVRDPSNDAGVAPPDAQVLPDGCTPTTAFADEDGDHYGDDARRSFVCGALPPSAAARGGDCDETDRNVNPAAPELCDNVDNDCNGTVDDDVEEREFYVDRDRDGFGVATESVRDCAPPPGYALTDGDCNDASAAIHPEATERCDAVDQDCDGGVDEGLLAMEEEALDIGHVIAGPRNLSLTRTTAGYAAAWVTPERDLVVRPLDARGQPTGAQSVVWTMRAPDVQHFSPQLAPLGAGAIVAWGEANGAYARALDPRTWTPTSEAHLLSDTGRHAMPLAVVELEQRAFVFWQERNGNDDTYVVGIDPATGAPLGEPVLLHQQQLAEPDVYGASIVTVDGMSDSVLMAVIDQLPPDGSASVYVHRIRLVPTLELDETPTILTLPERAVPTRVVLTAALDGQAVERSVIASVSWGERPDRSTVRWRVLPAATGSLDRAEPLGEPIAGMALDGASAAAGADLLLVDEDPLDRETVRLVHQPLALGRHAELAAEPRFEPSFFEGTWAATAERTDLRGVVLVGGRRSATALEPDVIAVPYSCMP